MNKVLLIVVGPTAVGKTDFCVRLAKALQTIIVSADSRQFYKELEIGTAKPTLSEQQNIPHFFIDNKSITETYTVADYEKEVIELLKEKFDTYNPIILSGGTGFFIDAVCNGLDYIPNTKPEIREALNSEFDQFGIEPLQKELELVDKEYFDTVDISNPQRVIRALEIFRSTGQKFSSFRKGEKKERFFKTIKIGLTRDREELYNRINLRVDQMMEKGLLNEVESVQDYKHLNALQTVGYNELFKFLENNCTLQEAVDSIKQNSRLYAKRQLTWFRRDSQIKWFHPNDFEMALLHIQELTKDLT